MTKRKQDLARPLAMCRNQVHLVTRALLFLFFFSFSSLVMPCLEKLI